MVVEQQTDQDARWVMHIKPFEKGCELARTMPLGYRVVYKAAHQIDRSR